MYVVGRFIFQGNSDNFVELYKFNALFLCNILFWSMPFTYMDKIMCFVRVFSENYLMIFFFSQQSIDFSCYSVFEKHPSLVPTGRDDFWSNFENFFKIPSLGKEWDAVFFNGTFIDSSPCTNPVICFYAIFSFEKYSFHLYPMGEVVF